MPKIKILVVDDHALVREGITSLLSRRKDIEVVGQASDGEQAVTKTAANRSSFAAASRGQKSEDQKLRS